MNTAGVYGYGLEFRTRIVDLVLGGATPEEAAHHFSVHVNTVKRYLERHRNNTLHVRVKPTGRHRTVTAAHEEQLLKQLDTHPDATLTEHARMLEDATGLKICFKTVDRVFARHQIIWIPFNWLYEATNGRGSGSAPVHTDLPATDTGPRAAQSGRPGWENVGFSGAYR